MLESDRSPVETAIVGSRDLVAIGAVAELRRRGAAIPDDLTVVGVDDDPVAAALGLTTLHYPYELSGRLAMRLLRSMLESPRDFVQAPAIELALKVPETWNWRR
ncbi:substrate-binding domain-containing protein [Jiangella asiatica]|uniref:Transcriptional regulator LacI/GalR-like sensor domain-containing protein n=1 Tax=Jiangella asiatica TaxID=2530372 RepID=A0A4R5DPX7_9ACTN|nr:substrate-binding domain-containing protein [Jiangella asiatica]TDE14230.1 hypothetical protein E1269_03495 [Jiangella asiatica]